MTTGSTFNTRPGITAADLSDVANGDFDHQEALAFARRVALANAAEHLLATLKTVRDAHQYDGALTMGTARLSPSILGIVERAIALVEEA